MAVNANGPPKRAARHLITAAPSPPSSRAPDDVSVADLHRFGEPSSYSLSAAELARHIRQLHRRGWQEWELHVRFGRAA
jgi:hypothetical protein